MAARPTISDFQRRTARRLRANATDAEARLWRHLRRVPFLGSHFRRQVPIGNYVADFACMAARLVVEIDGSQHGKEANKIKDDERTRWLAIEGCRVVRFWNNDIIENIDGVLETIYDAIYGSSDVEPKILKHRRHPRAARVHPTPARRARRPSPSRGG